MFSQATEEILSHLIAGYQWDVNDINAEQGIRAKEFIVLTLCSYDFRLFVTIHFTCNTRSIEYVADALRVPSDQVTRERFFDYMGEFGNNLCGGLKRELGQIFSHLGMSTPDRLEERSFKYFSFLKYEHALNKAVTSNTGIYLAFGLYVCPYGDLDFVMPQMVESTAKGEIELF